MQSEKCKTQNRMTHEKTVARIAALAVLMLAAGPAAAVESVRVDASSGAPRIVIDGKPVRARLFFGLPGAAALSLKTTEQIVTFTFTAPDDEPARATMHFRFGDSPGDVFLDDIRCVDSNTGREVFPTATFEGGMHDFQKSWHLWPPGAANTAGAVTVEPGKGRHGSAALHVVLKSPPNGQWPDFHIYHNADLTLRKGHHYRVSFWARSRPARDQVKVAFYRPGAQYQFLGGPPNAFQSQIKLAAAAGVDLVTFGLGMPWPKPGEAADWSAVDGTCRMVLEANPRALLLPRFDMEPPGWWLTEHPDDLMVWDQPGHHRRLAVVASPAYRRDAAERLAAFVAHLEKSFGPHMAGYHPCGQNTGEWFYEGTWERPLNGYSKASLAAWRAWIKNYYRSDAALRAAWRNPHVSRDMTVDRPGTGSFFGPSRTEKCACPLTTQLCRDTVAVPAPAARRAAPAGVLRDPKAERSLIDFAQFQQEAMADCVCHFAHTVRQASRGRRLVVFFYGYLFEFGAVANAPATSGHYALRRVLNCPDIDVLCSPISYFDRGLGQSAPAMSAAESVALAGKMWLDEDDTRTYLAGPKAGYNVVRTIQETNQELLRNTAQCALRNFGTWWMDLPAEGWFNDPRIWAEMARLKALDEPLLKNPRPFRPEVAAVIDEASMIRVAAEGRAATLPLIYEVRRPLGRSGAPYGQYLQDDVAAGRVHAKMYVFLSAWRLEPAERQKLLDATRGKLRIWCYAPGYQEDHGTSLDAMRQLTGFRMKQLTGVHAWAEPTAAGRKLGLHEAFGSRQAIRPLFAAADATPDETLATYSDGSPAVALRQTNNGLSLFVGPPALTSDLVRLAARKAGVHLITQTDCNVWSNGPYLSLHASQNGPLTVDTGLTGEVRDLLTGKSLGEGPTITLPMRFGETRVLCVRRK